MDNPHCDETNTTDQPTKMEGLNCVTMLPEQFLNWCLTGLDKANESLRMLVSTSPAKALSKDMATITEPQLLKEKPTAKLAGNKKSPTSNTKRKKLVYNIKEMFPYRLDEIRNVLYADDDHMLRQELAEEHHNANFLNQIDRELNHKPLNAKLAQEALIQQVLQHERSVPTRSETSSTHKLPQSRESRLCRLLGGGVKDRCCRCNCCGRSCHAKRNSRTFIEYDWTNYDWCKPLRAELQRRTKHLNRLKRELQLRAIRVLPNVTHF